MARAPDTAARCGLADELCSRKARRSQLPGPGSQRHQPPPAAQASERRENAKREALTLCPVPRAPCPSNAECAPPPPSTAGAAGSVQGGLSRQERQPLVLSCQILPPGFPFPGVAYIIFIPSTAYAQEQRVTFRGLAFQQQLIFQNYFLLSLNRKEMDDIIRYSNMAFAIF